MEILRDSGLIETHKGLKSVIGFIGADLVEILNVPHHESGIKYPISKFEITNWNKFTKDIFGFGFTFRSYDLQKYKVVGFEDDTLYGQAMDFREPEFTVEDEYDWDLRLDVYSETKPKISEIVELEDYNGKYEIVHLVDADDDQYIATFKRVEKTPL